MRRRSKGLLALTIVTSAGVGLHFFGGRSPRSLATHPPSAVRRSVKLTNVQRLIVASARDQLSWGTKYDARYRDIAYPNGDVPRTRGACSDVVVRCLRKAGLDLQAAIHKDMAAHRNLYPHPKIHPAPDPNIDHRRVFNQRVFFSRFAQSLPLDTRSPADWLPGDIVEWSLGTGHEHTGVLSDRLDAQGYPFVVHNKGPAPSEEDALRRWTIIGHFRYRKV